MLGEKIEGCALSKVIYLATDKRKSISCPLFLEYLIFLSFQNFNELEKE
jgi:hypothetical protein